MPPIAAGIKNSRPIREVERRSPRLQISKIGQRGSHNERQH